MSKKICWITASTDERTVELLKLIGEYEREKCKSRLLTRIIEESAYRRGLMPERIEDGPEPGQ